MPLSTFVTHTAEEQYAKNKTKIIAACRSSNMFALLIQKTWNKGVEEELTKADIHSFVELTLDHKIKDKK